MPIDTDNLFESLINSSDAAASIDDITFPEGWNVTAEELHEEEEECSEDLIDDDEYVYEQL